MWPLLSAAQMPLCFHPGVFFLWLGLYPHRPQAEFGRRGEFPCFLGYFSSRRSYCVIMVRGMRVKVQAHFLCYCWRASTVLKFEGECGSFLLPIRTTTVLKSIFALILSCPRSLGIMPTAMFSISSYERRGKFYHALLWSMTI